MTHTCTLYKTKGYKQKITTQILLLESSHSTDIGTTVGWYWNNRYCLQSNHFHSIVGRTNSIYYNKNYCLFLTDNNNIRVNQRRTPGFGGHGQFPLTLREQTIVFLTPYVHIWLIWKLTQLSELLFHPLEHSFPALISILVTLLHS